MLAYWVSLTYSVTLVTQQLLIKNRGTLCPSFPMAGGKQLTNYKALSRNTIQIAGLPIECGNCYLVTIINAKIAVKRS